MNIYQTSTKRKRLKLATFWWWAKGSKEAASEWLKVLHTHFCSLSSIHPSSNQEHQPSMTTVSLASPYSRFIEIETGLNNYHKIAVCDHILVPKVWYMWHTAYIMHHTFYLVIFLTNVSKPVLIYIEGKINSAKTNIEVSFKKSMPSL